MNTMASRLATPIPDRMKALPRDKRGYPIPANVYRDAKGDPHFTVNDELIRQKFIAEDKCPICAQTLLRGRWFMGGPRSAFHSQGWYNDTAMHYECVEYALKVCPYLAAPRYSGRIDALTVPEEERNVITFDVTQDPNRPQMFVAVMAVGQTMSVMPNAMIAYVRPLRPYRIVEFWRNGTRISSQEGIEIAMQADISSSDIAECITKKTMLRCD